MFRKKRIEEVPTQQKPDEVVVGRKEISEKIDRVKTMISGKYRRFSDSEIEANIEDLTNEYCELINKFFMNSIMIEIMSLLESGRVSKDFAIQTINKINQTYYEEYKKNFNDYTDFIQKLSNSAESQENEQAQPQSE